MRHFLFYILLLSLALELSAQPCREVIAYYPNWQWYDRNQLVGPGSIDYSQYTIINYSFFKPETDGSISSTDSWADENLLLGQPDWQNGGYLPNTSLIDLAHNQGVKVLASIGGWTLSYNFPSIAADSASRVQFAGSCCDLIRAYEFDGIDMDWEYPGFATHNGTAYDGVNFTLLMGTIRDSLDALSTVSGNNYLLTSCFSADPAKMSIIEWNELDSIIDYFNLMSYDFFGAWDAVSNHNSPLYAPMVGDSNFNIDAAFTNLSQVYGVNPAKINIGIAYYGRSVVNCTNLHGPSGQSPDITTFWEDDGNPLYYNILDKINLFSYHWDAQANVPYLLGNSINTFVSYDDERSIADKAQYVVDKDAAGVIIWELTGDYLESSGQVAGTPLSDTLNAVLCGLVTSGNKLDNSSMAVRLSPNPQRVKQIVYLRYEMSKTSRVEISVVDMTGRILLSEVLPERMPGKYSWTFSCSLPGIYHVILRTASYRTVVPVVFRP